MIEISNESSAASNARSAGVNRTLSGPGCRYNIGPTHTTAPTSMDEVSGRSKVSLA
jgi:hypothetical protein